MVDAKRCPDCGELRPASEFTRNRAQKDGLAFYCRRHARARHLTARRAREGAPRSRHAHGVDVPIGSKWCPDCDEVKSLSEFPSSARSRTGRYTYCKPCHNKRGKATLDRVGGARTYHLKRRYGITAAEANAMLDAQGGLCAICRAAPAVHVDHDHATDVVRELLCFNCNGGLGQFRDDPDVLLAAVAYLQKHGTRPRPISGPPAAGCAVTPRLGSDRRERRGPRPGRRSTDRPAPGSVDQHGAGPDGPAEEAHG